MSKFAVAALVLAGGVEAQTLELTGPVNLLGPESHLGRGAPGRGRRGRDPAAHSH